MTEFVHNLEEKTGGHESPCFHWLIKKFMISDQTKWLMGVFLWFYWFILVLPCIDFWYMVNTSFACKTTFYFPWKQISCEIWNFLTLYRPQISGGHVRPFMQQTNHFSLGKSTTIFRSCPEYSEYTLLFNHGKYQNKFVSLHTGGIRDTCIIFLSLEDNDKNSSF